MKKYILLSFICLVSTTFFSQEKKDTLFFHYEKNYLLTFEEVPDHLYPKDTGENAESFFFKKKGIYFNLKPKKILFLKKFIRTSIYFDKTKTIKLNDLRLAQYLGAFEIFLVKGEDENKIFIKVAPSVEIY